MTSYKLNKLLIEAFPNLKEAYEEEVIWQEGDGTGAHIVYGDIFVPIWLNVLMSRLKMR